MKLTWKNLLPAGMVALAALVGADLVHGMLKKPEAPPLPKPEAPPGAIDPGSTAVYPKGAEWQAYLAQPPLVVGSRAPTLTVTDYRGETLHLPAHDRPSVWMVFCGCPECRYTGANLFRLQQRVGDKLQTVVFFSNNSDYLWGRVTASFGARFRLISDTQGTYYARLRAPGATHSPLPMVWGLDRRGRVVFFGRQGSEDGAWTREL
ncbi:MAG TPA: hypothetical protein VFU47_06770, partial [Armatimonadota bacterium]|nr:hypothetical protein [Armatimonadota bacterium]